MYQVIFEEGPVDEKVEAPEDANLAEAAYHDPRGDPAQATRVFRVEEPLGEAHLIGLVELSTHPHREGHYPYRRASSANQRLMDRQSVKPQCYSVPAPAM